MSSSRDMETHLHALMLASLDGDGRAYRSLLEALRGPLVRYYSGRLGAALAANCDDLVQDTLMAIHMRRLTYDRNQPLTAWVYAIARYKLIDHFRRHRLRATVPLEDDVAIFASDDAGDAMARRDVDVVLGSIPARPADLIRAELVLFETDSGGAVFATGSITWCGGLPVNGYDNPVSRITGNVLRRFLAGDAEG